MGVTFRRRQTSQAGTFGKGGGCIGLGSEVSGGADFLVVSDTAASVPVVAVAEKHLIHLNLLGGLIKIRSGPVVESVHLASFRPDAMQVVDRGDDHQQFRAVKRNWFGMKVGEQGGGASPDLIDGLSKDGYKVKRRFPR